MSELSRRERVMQAAAAEARHQGITVEGAQIVAADRAEKAAIAERRYVAAWVDAENAAFILDALTT